MKFAKIDHKPQKDVNSNSKSHKIECNRAIKVYYCEFSAYFFVSSDGYQFDNPVFQLPLFLCVWPEI